MNCHLVMPASCSQSSLKTDFFAHSGFHSVPFQSKINGLQDQYLLLVCLNIVWLILYMIQDFLMRIHLHKHNCTIIIKYHLQNLPFQNNSISTFLTHNKICLIFTNCFCVYRRVYVVNTAKLFHFFSDLLDLGTPPNIIVCIFLNAFN